MILGFSILVLLLQLGKTFSNIEEKSYQFRKSLSLEDLELFQGKYNFTYLNDIFTNSTEIHPILVEIVSKHNFVDPDAIDESDEGKLALQYNNYLAEAFFLLGEIEYFGLVSRKQNLLGGFGHYLTAAYFGNPQSLYKMYVLLETNIISVILRTKEFDRLFSNKASLLHHIRHSQFYDHFSFIDDYGRKAAGLLFLSSAALSNHQTAMTALGYKYYKGYGVSYSCDSSLKYYKAVSHEVVKDIYKRKIPFFYEKTSLEQYEYIGYKFGTESYEIEEIIDYFRVEAENGHLNYIQQLGTRYLFGQGIDQNFNEAFYYFSLGKAKNDSVSNYFLGEMYLNGWGVEKVCKI